MNVPQQSPGPRGMARPAMTVGALQRILAKMPQDAAVEILIEFPQRGISIVKGGKLKCNVRYVNHVHTAFGDSVHLSPTEEPKIHHTSRQSSQKGRK